MEFFICKNGRKFWHMLQHVWNSKDIILRKISQNNGKILYNSTCMNYPPLLSCFSRVWLCATPQMAAHQAPPSLGFSRQEHWSGLPFLSQCMKVKSESEVAQLCPTLRDPIDCNLPGSSAHGIFQARVLEWGAISFSDMSHLEWFNS